MSEVKTDLRIIKTKRSIYTAFLELLETKAFEEIKVSEICTGALVNRSTFYTHFEDKYMLLDCLIKDMKHILKNLLAENDNIDNSKAYYMEVMKILFDHIEENKKFYMTVIANNRNSVAMDMVYATLREDLEQRISKERKTDIPSEIIAGFYIGAIFNVGLYWLQNKCNYPKEDMLGYLEKLIEHGI